MTLTNRSEVTARYLLRPDVALIDPTVAYPDKAAFLGAIAVTANAANPTAVYSPTDGVVVPYESTVKLDLTIPAITFTGLKIDVISTQVD